MRERADYLAALAQGRDRLVAAAGAAGLTTTVPTARRWTVRELVVHVGNVHDWAGGILRTGEELPQDFAAGLAVAGDDPLALLDWYVDRADALIAGLDSGVPGDDAPCWTFGPPGQASFWARRQAHELAIHALDAERAAAVPVAAALSAMTPEFGADGVDEVVTVMLPRVAQFRPRPELPAPLALVSTDTGDRWELERDGQVREIGGDVGAELRGPAVALDALLWKRATLDVDGAGLDVAIDGDEAVVAALFAARLTP